jgi:hypothetical protein
MIYVVKLLSKDLKKLIQKRSGWKIGTDNSNEKKY